MLARLRQGRTWVHAHVRSRPESPGLAATPSTGTTEATSGPSVRTTPLDDPLVADERSLRVVRRGVSWSSVWCSGASRDSGRFSPRSDRRAGDRVGRAGVDGLVIATRGLFSPGGERRFGHHHGVSDDLPLRSNRDFLALWTGQAASAVGTSISALAYPLVILAVSGSPTLAGVGASVLAATAFVVRIPAGVIVDRVDRKHLMLACDAGRFVAVSSLALLAATGELLIWHILVVAVVEGTLGSLFATAEAVAVRLVVRPSQVRDAVARNEARQQLAALVGPSIGGALLGLGRALPFLADALSYAVSFATVATVRTPLTPPGPRPPRRALREDLLQGLAWLWTQPFLRFVVLWLSGAGVLFTSIGLVALVLARDLGATPAQIGLMFTLSGSGGLLGAAAAPRLLRRLRPTVVVLGYAWVASAATFLLLAAQSVWALGLIGAIAFFPVPALNAMVLSEVAVQVPESLHGRAVSATVQLTTLLHPLGPTVAGIALEVLGSSRTVLIYGTALTGLALIASVSRTVRAGPGSPPTLHG